MITFIGNPEKCELYIYLSSQHTIKFVHFYIVPGYKFEKMNCNPMLNASFVIMPANRSFIFLDW